MTASFTTPTPVDFAAKLNRLLRSLGAPQDDSTAHALLTLAAALRPAEDDPITPAIAFQMKASGLTYWQFRRVVTHVVVNLEQSPRVADLAALVRLSASQFFRCCKVSIGLTPTTYILPQRIARSQQLLLETHDTIVDVALACGFADQAHFSSRFRNVVGKSPSRWRKQHRMEM